MSIERTAIEAAIVNVYNVAERIENKHAKKMAQRFEKKDDSHAHIELDQMHELFDEKLVEKTRAKLDLMVQQMWYEKDAKGFVEKTLKQAFSRLMLYLKISSALGKDEFINAVASGYHGSTVQDVLSKLQFEAKNESEMSRQTLNLLMALHYDTDKKTDDLMTEKDADGSGFLKTDEVPDMDFSTVDVDSSGLISKPELRKWHANALKQNITDFLQGKLGSSFLEAISGWTELNKVANDMNLNEYPTMILQKFVDLAQENAVDEILQSQIPAAEKKATEQEQEIKIVASTSQSEVNDVNTAHESRFWCFSCVSD